MELVCEIKDTIDQRWVAGQTLGGARDDDSALNARVVVYEKKCNQIDVLSKLKLSNSNPECSSLSAMLVSVQHIQGVLKI